jgi:hypothetical protein
MTGKMKSPACAGLFENDRNEDELEVVDQVRENVTNRRAEQGQNDDNHNSDQNQNQSVFHQTLAFFTGHVQHVRFPPFLQICKFILAWQFMGVNEVYNVFTGSR